MTVPRQKKLLKESGMQKLSLPIKRHWQKRCLKPVRRFNMWECWLRVTMWSMWRQQLREVFRSAIFRPTGRLRWRRWLWLCCWRRASTWALIRMRWRQENGQRVQTGVSGNIRWSNWPVRQWASSDLAGSDRRWAYWQKRLVCGCLLMTDFPHRRGERLQIMWNWMSFLPHQMWYPCIARCLTVPGELLTKKVSTRWKMVL